MNLTRYPYNIVFLALLVNFFTAYTLFGGDVCSRPFGRCRRLRFGCAGIDSDERSDGISLGPTRRRGVECSGRHAESFG